MHQGELSVRQMGMAEGAEWNRFVASTPRTSFSHRFEWADVCRQAYGLESRRLGVFRDSRLVAVFPVVLMPALLKSRGLAVSLPFCSEGDLACAPDQDPDAARDACLQHLAGDGIDRVEVRRLLPGGQEEGESTLYLPLPASVDELWSRVGDKVRNQVRKAEKSGLVLEWGGGQSRVLQHIYAQNMGRLGTPAHSARYFEAVLKCYGEDANVLTVRLGQEAVGAMLTIRHRDVLSVPTASTLAQHNRLNPNMLMYWTALRHAVESGLAWFDFGRSPVGAGTYRFKKQWGAEAISLRYTTFVQGAPQPVSSATVYRSPLAVAVKEIWKRMPGFLQRCLGPHVRRRMP